MDGLAQDLLHDRNVRVGVVDFFIAAANTDPEAASGWVWTGAIDPGSQEFDFPVEKFELKLGLPNTVKAEAIIGIEGNVRWTANEYTAALVDLASGGARLTKEFAANPTPTTTDAAEAWTVNGGKLTAVAGYGVGNRIEVELPDGSVEDTYIETINAGTSTITVKPALSQAPGFGADVKAIYQYVKPIGGVDIVKKAVKTVFTDRNLEQAIVYLPEVSSNGGYRPNFGDARTNAKLPVDLRAYGREITYDGKKQPIVGYTYLKFPNVTKA